MAHFMRHFGGSNTTIVNNNFFNVRRPMNFHSHCRPTFFSGFGGGGGCCGGGGGIFNAMATFSMANMFLGNMANLFGGARGNASSGFFGGGYNTGYNGGYNGGYNYNGYGNYKNNTNSNNDGSNIKELKDQISDIQDEIKSIQDLLSNDKKNDEITANNADGKNKKTTETNEEGSSDSVVNNNSNSNADNESVDVNTNGSNAENTEAKNKHNAENEIDYSKIKDGMNMSCRDASGKTKNIQGTFNILEKDDDNAVPSKFTITDSSTGTGNVYTYELTKVTDDNKAVYNCIDKNGNKITSGNEYILEAADELLQKEGMDGFGKGLRPDKK